MSRSPSPVLSEELEAESRSASPDQLPIVLTAMKSDLLLSRDDDKREAMFEIKYGNFIAEINAMQTQPADAGEAGKAENAKAIAAMYDATIRHLCLIFPDYSDVDAEGKKIFPDYRNDEALKRYITVGTPDSRKNFCISLIKGAFFATHEKDGALVSAEEVKTQSSIFTHALNIEACEGGAISSIERRFFGGSELWQIAGEEFISLNRFRCHLGNQAHLPAFFNFINNRRTDDNFYRLPGIDFTIANLIYVLRDIAVCEVNMVISGVAREYVELVRKAWNDANLRATETNDREDLFAVMIFDALKASSNPFLKQVARSGENLEFANLLEDDNEEQEDEEIASDFLITMLLKAVDANDNPIGDIYEFSPDLDKLKLVVEVAAYAVKSMEIPLWLQQQIIEAGGLENLISETVTNPGFEAMLRQQIRYANLPSRAEELTLQRLITEGALHSEIKEFLDNITEATPEVIGTNYLLSINGLLFHPERQEIFNSLQEFKTRFPTSFSISYETALKKAVELGDTHFLDENFATLRGIVVQTENEQVLRLNLNDVKSLFFYALNKRNHELDAVEHDYNNANHVNEDELKRFIESLLLIEIDNGINYSGIVLHYAISPVYLEYFGYDGRVDLIRDICQNSDPGRLYNLLGYRSNLGFQLPMMIAKLYPSEFANCFEEMDAVLPEEHKRELFVEDESDNGWSLPMMVATFCPNNFNEFFTKIKGLMDDQHWQELATSQSTDLWSAPALVAAHCSTDTCKNFIKDLKENLNAESKNHLANNLNATGYTFLMIVAQLHPNLFEEALDMLKGMREGLLPTGQNLLSSVMIYCPQNLGKTLATLVDSTDETGLKTFFEKLGFGINPLLFRVALQSPQQTKDILPKLTQANKKQIYFHKDPLAQASILAAIAFHRNEFPETFDYALSEAEKLVKDGAVNRDEMINLMQSILPATLTAAGGISLSDCIKSINNEAAVRFKTTVRETLGIDLDQDLPTPTITDPSGRNVADSARGSNHPR